MSSSLRMGSGTRNNCVNKRHAEELCVLISSDDEAICFTHAASSKPKTDGQQKYPVGRGAMHALAIPHTPLNDGTGRLK